MDGLFREGKFVHGKISLAEGDFYEGSLVDMKKTGKGLYQKKNLTYDGYFQDDVFEGTGAMTTTDKNGTDTHNYIG